MKILLTVSEITSQIKRTLESNFSELNVIGEISNFKSHVSGHWYFTIKDANAQISCTMWRGVNSSVFFTPQDGMKVVVSGKISVYPPRGAYQIDVRSMQPAGEGELQAAFEKLKRKLSGEGLFDVEFKKPVPRFPERIGIVTAIGGAALKDMISVAERRYPVAELVIVPSKVQGEGAAVDIAYNINLLNKEKDIDVLIVGRGGGSLEDLWAFNEEVVVRAIFNSHIPVISGIGHEVDFTIADFVADLRAPTPSAAMELATPDKNEILGFIREFSYNSAGAIQNRIDWQLSDLMGITNSYGFKTPHSIVKSKSQLLDSHIFKIQSFFDTLITQKNRKLELLSKSLEAFDVDKIMKKGFAIISQDGMYVTRGKDLNSQSPFKIKFYDKDVSVDKNG